MKKLWRRRAVRASSMVLIGVLIGVGGLVVVDRLAHPAVAAATSPAAAAADRVVAAAVGTVQQSITSTGTLTPSVQDSVNFAVPGTVTEVKVAAGATVAKGQVLATVSTLNLQAALVTAQSALTSARAKLAGDQNTLAANQAAAASAAAASSASSIAAASSSASVAATATSAPAPVLPEVASAQAVESSAQAVQSSAQAVAAAAQDQQLTAQIAQDRAAIPIAANQVTTAQANLGAAMLTSPVDGIVATVNLAVGQTVSGTGTSSGGSGSGSSGAGSSGSGSSGSGGSGTGGSGSGGSGSGSSGSGSGASSSSSAQFLIAGTSTWAVDVTVDDTQVGLLKVGDQAQITPSSSSTPIFGTVASIGLIATGSGTTAGFPVVVNVTGSPAGLYDGTSVTVELIYKQLVNVLTVPSAAVHTSSGAQYVEMVGADGKQVKTPITAGLSSGGLTEITAGLAEGDEVAVPQSGTGRTGGTGSLTGTGGRGGGFGTGLGSGSGGFTRGGGTGGFRGAGGSGSGGN